MHKVTMESQPPKNLPAGNFKVKTEDDSTEVTTARCSLSSVANSNAPATNSDVSMISSDAEQRPVKVERREQSANQSEQAKRPRTEAVAPCARLSGARNPIPVVPYDLNMLERRLAQRNSSSSAITAPSATTASTSTTSVMTAQERLRAATLIIKQELSGPVIESQKNAQKVLDQVDRAKELAAASAASGSVQPKRATRTIVRVKVEDQNQCQAVSALSSSRPPPAVSSTTDGDTLRIFLNDDIALLNTRLQVNPSYIIAQADLLNLIARARVAVRPEPPYVPIADYICFISFDGHEYCAVYLKHFSLDGLKAEIQKLLVREKAVTTPIGNLFVRRQDVNVKLVEGPPMPFVMPKESIWRTEVSQGQLANTLDVVLISHAN